MPLATRTHRDRSGSYAVNRERAVGGRDRAAAAQPAVDLFVTIEVQLDAAGQHVGQTTRRFGNRSSGRHATACDRLTAAVAQDTADRAEPRHPHHQVAGADPHVVRHRAFVLSVRRSHRRRLASETAQREEAARIRGRRFFFGEARDLHSGSLLAPHTTDLDAGDADPAVVDDLSRDRVTASERDDQVGLLLFVGDFDIQHRGQELRRQRAHVPGAGLQPADRERAGAVRRRRGRQAHAQHRLVGAEAHAFDRLARFVANDTGDPRRQQRHQVAEIGITAISRERLPALGEDQVLDVERQSTNAALGHREAKPSVGVSARAALELALVGEGSAAEQFVIW